MSTHGDGGVLRGVHLKRDDNDRLTMVTDPSPWPQTPGDLTPAQTRVLTRLRANKGGGLYLRGADVRVARRLEALGLVKLEDNGDMRKWPGGPVDGERWYAEALGRAVAQG